MISLIVISNINSFETARRFAPDTLVKDLKEKLELLTGASPTSMKVQLLSKNKDIVAELSDETASLATFPVEDGMYLNVIDACHKAGQFEDVTVVEKFELSKEEYAKRENTFRAFKDKMKLDQRNEEEDIKKLELEEKLVGSFKIGDRCEVVVAGKPARRGTVMFLGKTDFKPGCWVGVKYDEPFGKNDGSVKGKRYFQCEPNYGGFVKPQDVTVGDFPEEGLEDEI